MGQRQGGFPATGFRVKLLVVSAGSAGYFLVMSRRFLLAVALAFAPVFPVAAQTPGSSPGEAGGEQEVAPEMDMEARRESVANLESHIAQREDRLAEWGRDIIELDSRIEKRVDEIVTLLAGLRDSQDSRVGVTGLKREAIEGLQRGIELYSRKQREVAERVRTGRDEHALEDLDRFDERIITRVEQIVTLARSIPTHRDVEKFETSQGSTYWSGYYRENLRISDEWRQNRRDTSASDQIRRQTLNDLRAEVERLDRRRRSHEDMLANRNLPDSERALYERELGQFDAHQDHLDSQIRLLTTSTAAGGEAIGRGQVHDIGRLLEDARRDLREDVARLFRAYDQFAEGRAYIENLRKNLELRQAWLKEHDSEAP